MGKFIDITGQKFNRLTAVKVVGKSPNGKSIVWEWQCDCGNITNSTAANVKNGTTKSCGCIAKDALIKRNTKHGMKNNPAYESWKGMFKRCYNKNCKSFKNYGGRGIGVHDSFRDFPTFLAEIGEKPSDGQRWSIGRIDNNKDYEPNNVRWETDDQQARNHTKQTNNTSGIVGVYISKTTIANKIYESFVGFYKNKDRKKISKSFSIEKYGYEEAKKLASQFRESGIESLKVDGVIYAESHGSEK